MSNNISIMINVTFNTIKLFMEKGRWEAAMFLIKQNNKFYENIDLVIAALKCMAELGIVEEYNLTFELTKNIAKENFEFWVQDAQIRLEKEFLLNFRKLKESIENATKISKTKVTDTLYIWYKIRLYGESTFKSNSSRSKAVLEIVNLCKNSLKNNTDPVINAVLQNELRFCLGYVDTNYYKLKQKEIINSEPDDKAQEIKHAINVVGDCLGNNLKYIEVLKLVRAVQRKHNSKKFGNNFIKSLSKNDKLFLKIDDEEFDSQIELLEKIQNKTLKAVLHDSENKKLTIIDGENRIDAKF